MARIYDRLRNLKNKDVSRFTLDGNKKYAKVMSIYDGDTCDLAFYLENKIMRYKCRMAGYDAPELHTRHGKRTRDYLAHLCCGGTAVTPADYRTQHRKLFSDEQLQTNLDANNRLVFATFETNDKYGRPVVTIYQATLHRNPPKVLETKGSINGMMATFIDKL